jgi:hypothetical protein
VVQFTTVDQTKYKKVETECEELETLRFTDDWHPLIDLALRSARVWRRHHTTAVASTGGRTAIVPVLHALFNYRNSLTFPSSLVPLNMARIWNGYLNFTSKIPKHSIRNAFHSSPLPRTQIYFCITAFRLKMLENNASNSRDSAYLRG